jgi:SsrA-binding protein
MAKGSNKKSPTPEIVNRRAHHEYLIEDTLEVGIALHGSEVKSIRDGKCSIAEGYVRAQLEPLRLELHGVHIHEYPPAAGANHVPTRSRKLLAHKREIEKLARASAQKGVTIVPLKLYFKEGWVKLLIGTARGKSGVDKRHTLKEREAQRDIQRAMSRKTLR